MRLGLVGDTHGNTKSFVHILNEMGSRKITHVFVVGDFGLWTHFADGHEFLDDVNSAAEGNNLSVLAVGGNHENWDHWEWFCANMPTHKGFAMVRRRVLLAPKVHDFRLANKQFVVAGGAVSIDKDSRLESERGVRDRWSGQVVKRGTGARTLWWPNEELTDDDVRKIEQTSPKADILLTHDCSNFTNFQHRLKPDPASERHRQRIDKVIKATEPKVHFHGHMHTKYEWENTLSHGDSAFRDEKWTGPVTKTYGLECDGDYNNWGILDTDTMEFAFRGIGMQFRSLE
jgi:Icc-related predicted phosphoesterase